MRIAYDSIAELARLAASETMTIGQLVLEEQAEQLGRTKEQLLAVLAIIPVVILFLIFQKYMMTGYSKAAMK